MRFGRKTLVAGALLACVPVVLFAHYQPPSLQRVNEQLGPDPDLVFEFGTGRYPSDRPCGEVLTGDDSESQTATAIAIGWLAGRCENGHAQLRLTSAGMRLSPRWSRAGEAPSATRTPEDPQDWTLWSVTAARFERTGVPEIQATDRRTRERVLVRGRWLANADGMLLQQAGWEAFRRPAVRDEEFELRLSGWHWIPNVIGHDLPGL